jgi:hypothetical protein
VGFDSPAGIAIDCLTRASVRILAIVRCVERKIFGGGSVAV